MGLSGCFIDPSKSGFRIPITLTLFIKSPQSTTRASNSKTVLSPGSRIKSLMLGIGLMERKDHISIVVPLGLFKIESGSLEIPSTVALSIYFKPFGSRSFTWNSDIDSSALFSIVNLNLTVSPISASISSTQFS